MTFAVNNLWTYFLQFYLFSSKHTVLFSTKEKAKMWKTYGDAVCVDHTKSKDTKYSRHFARVLRISKNLWEEIMFMQKHTYICTYVHKCMCSCIDHSHQLFIFSVFNSIFCGYLPNMGLFNCCPCLSLKKHITHAHTQLHVVALCAYVCVM